MTILRYFDKTFKFAEIFDTDSGFYLKTAVLDENGKETAHEPFMRSFPSLLDIGIMGRCSSVDSCRVGCYQQGAGNKLGHNMTLEAFKRIIDEVSGKTFEVALGGFGNPNEHPDFVEIVRYAREKNVIPNYTTAGNRLTDEQIEATLNYCGAVAVSWHRQSYTINAINRFLAEGVKTNIHFVLGNDSIDEAILRLEEGAFPEGINAVIFLLYKPVGKVKDGNVLSPSDPKVQRFYELVETPHRFKVGLDACHMPGVVNNTTKLLEEAMSPCDAARFSMYITPDGMALPCSFDTTRRKWAFDLKEGGVIGAWTSESFKRFRRYHAGSCSGCKLSKNCFGGCPLMGEEINLCEREERDYVNEI